MSNITWEEPTDTDENGEPNRVREFPMGVDGVVLYIRRGQPHGMFEFAMTHGPVPDKLKGLWTELGMAEIAGQSYVNATVSPAKFKPKGTPIRTKSPETVKRNLEAAK
jgi:hypothetical protein